MKQADSIQKLREDANALDEIGPVAWDDADAKRKQADALEAALPHYDVRGALVLSLSLASVAGLFAYLVNGHDVVRAGVAGFIWLAIGWYSGKVMLRRKTSSSHDAGSQGQGG
jgi:hypothetical protein